MTLTSVGLPLDIFSILSHFLANMYIDYVAFVITLLRKITHDVMMFETAKNGRAREVDYIGCYICHHHQRDSVLLPN